MSNMTGSEPLAAQARQLVQAGEWQQAADVLRQLIGEVTGVAAGQLTINRDQYSLNSLNGTVTLEDGRALFFKYHNEEGEDKTIEEYYNAELLRESGFPFCPRFRRRYRAAYEHSGGRYGIRNGV